LGLDIDGELMKNWWKMGVFRFSKRVVGRGVLQNWGVWYREPRSLL